MKRYLTELKDEELLKVYDANKVLQDELYEIEYENVQYHVTEIINHLEAFHAIESFNIDINSNNNFIVVDDAYIFFENVYGMLYNYGIDELNAELIKETQDGMQFCLALDSVEKDSDVYNVLENYVHELRSIVVDKVIKLLLNILELDTETLKTMFIKYVTNYETFDNVYIKDDSYVAYEEFTREYKDGRYR
jgi:hypothetical protein